MRVALYARYSSDQQRETSIEDQFRNCRRRVEAAGWTIVALFSDAAISGSDSNRPQYQQMIAAAMRKEFDVLVVDELSRLSRDLMESESVIRKLEFKGVRIIAVSDGYDSSSKAAKVHRVFKGVMNEMELDALSQRVHRGQEGQARAGRWNGGRAYGYVSVAERDPHHTDPFSEAKKIGSKLMIHPKQAPIVRQIFAWYVEGLSCRNIAARLNERGVPSPGSTWKRQTYRRSKWVQATIRGLVRNPLYTGLVNWNQSKFVRNPETEKIVRRHRPKAEWVSYQDESLRIIPQEVFDAASVRTEDTSNSDGRLKSGGKAKYLLSGLLRCEACGAHYVMADARAYACSSFVNGKACTNNARVRRDVVERAVLRPVTEELLRPDRVRKMADEIQRLYEERMQQSLQRQADVPRELIELESRLERLRERLRKGDPDLTEDELELAINRAEAKRSELVSAQLGAKAPNAVSLLPKAAEVYRRQIAAGLGDHPDATAKAKMLIKELIGPIRLKPDANGELWAEYALQPAVLLRAAGTDGRGDRI